MNMCQNLPTTVGDEALRSAILTGFCNLISPNFPGMTRTASSKMVELAAWKQEGDHERQGIQKPGLGK